MSIFPHLVPPLFPPMRKRSCTPDRPPSLPVRGCRPPDIATSSVPSRLPERPARYHHSCVIMRWLIRPSTEIQSLRWRVEWRVPTTDRLRLDRLTPSMSATAPRRQSRSTLVTRWRRIHRSRCRIVRLLEASTLRLQMKWHLGMRQVLTIERHLFILRSTDNLVIWVFCHLTGWSSDNLVIWYLVIWPYGHLIIWIGHLVIWQFGNNLVIWQFDHLVIWQFGYLVSDHLYCFVWKGLLCSMDLWEDMDNLRQMFDQTPMNLHCFLSYYVLWYCMLIIWYCVMFYHILGHIALYIVSYCIVLLYCIIVFHIILHKCIAWYCIMLYCIISYFIVLDRILLHYNVP